MLRKAFSCVWAFAHNYLLNCVCYIFILYYGKSPFSTKFPGTFIKPMFRDCSTMFMHKIVLCGESVRNCGNLNYNSRSCQKNISNSFIWNSQLASETEEKLSDSYTLANILPVMSLILHDIRGICASPFPRQCGKTAAPVWSKYTIFKICLEYCICIYLYIWNMPYIYGKNMCFLQL